MTDSTFGGATPSEGAPRPWKIVPYVDAIHVMDADGACVLSLSDRPITDFGSLPPENARLIVAAVNDHDALRTERDALKAEVQRLREAGEAAKELYRLGGNAASAAYRGEERAMRRLESRAQSILAKLDESQK